MEENKQLTCLFNLGFCHFMCMPSLIFNENLDVAVSKIEKQLYHRTVYNFPMIGCVCKCVMFCPFSDALSS